MRSLPVREGESVSNDAEPGLHGGVVLEAIVDERETVKLLEERRPERRRLVVSEREMRGRFSRLHVDQDRVGIPRAKLSLARRDGMRRTVDFENVDGIAGLRQQLVAEWHDAFSAKLGLARQEPVEGRRDGTVGGCLQRDDAEGRVTVMDEVEHVPDAFARSEARRMAEVVARRRMCEVTRRAEVRDDVGSDQLRTRGEHLAEYGFDAFRRKRPPRASALWR